MDDKKKGIVNDLLSKCSVKYDKDMVDIKIRMKHMIQCELYDQLTNELSPYIKDQCPTNLLALKLYLETVEDSSLDPVLIPDFDEFIMSPEPVDIGLVTKKKASAVRKKAKRKVKKKAKVKK